MTWEYARTHRGAADPSLEHPPLGAGPVSRALRVTPSWPPATLDSGPSAPVSLCPLRARWLSLATCHRTSPMHRAQFVPNRPATTGRSRSRPGSQPSTAALSRGSILSLPSWTPQSCNDTQQRGVTPGVLSLARAWQSPEHDPSCEPATGGSQTGAGLGRKLSAAAEVTGPNLTCYTSGAQGD